MICAEGFLFELERRGYLSRRVLPSPEYPILASLPPEVRGMFEEMVGWAVEGGADMIIGETFYYAGEALAALDVAKATGLPVVVTSRRWIRWPTPGLETCQPQQPRLVA